MLPKEWTIVMRPLQDQCEPTRYEDIEKLFLTDIGSSISDIFEDFDPHPIGVASLAQVHVGRHRESGKPVAIKVYIRKFGSRSLFTARASVATSTSCRIL
jgi:aarF domain-containing kinase